MTSRLCSIILSVLCSVASLTAQQSVIVEFEQASWVTTSALRARPMLPDALMQRSSARIQNATQREALRSMQRYAVLDLPATWTQRTLDSLRLLPGVRSVRLNHRIAVHDDPITNDSLSADQYALRIVRATDAWTIATGRGVTVGVIDTGIDWTHPDLRDQLAVRTAEDRNGNGRFEAWSVDETVNGLTGDLDGIDNDGNGWIDDVIGFDFVDQRVRNIGDDQTPDAVPLDEQGHGTSVAGVVAAQVNNTVGIAGLAPDARIVTLRAFDATGNGEEDDIAAAILYAALNGVDIVNMSFGDGVDSPVIRDAVHTAALFGCTLIASVGNTGSTSRQYPASYDDVIAVGATTETDTRAAFSSTGSSVALTAPGQNIITTRVGGRYRVVNGTSFAAPYVAAAAALVREADPGVDAAAMRARLSETSDDLGEPGWDGQFGAGRLRADAAVKAVGVAVVSITTPENEQTIGLRPGVRVVVTGTATSTEFSSWRLELGTGDEPDSFTEIASGQEQVIDARLAELDQQDLPRSTYTLRLVGVNQNGRTHESRRRFTTYSIGSGLYPEVEFVPAWSLDRRTMVATVRAQYPTTLSMQFASDRDTVRAFDPYHRTSVHSIAVDGLAPDTPYGCTLTFVRAPHDTVPGGPYAVQQRTDAMPSVNGRQVWVSSVPGYLLNEVVDLYGDGEAVFAMSDLSDGSFGRLTINAYRGGKFVVRDSLDRPFIPRGFGDSNGDGIIELFAGVIGSCILYQAPSQGGSVFGRVIFADTTSGNATAVGMADVDRDGRDELLCMSDSGIVAYTYRNGSYQQLASAVNPTPGASPTSRSRYDEVSVAVGNTDADANTELIYGDADGDLLFFEFRDGAFQQEQIVRDIGGGGSGYVKGLDVTGDGRMDVVHGIPDSTGPNSEGEYGRQLWRYRLYTSTSENTYQRIWEDAVHGVRYGIGYRNMVDGGQLDMRDGDEIAICAFPRLYVFTYDRAADTVKPMYFMDNVVTPRAIIHDFDADGMNELGVGRTVSEFGAMTSLVGLEIDTTAGMRSAPSGLHAVILDSARFELRWSPVEGATAYVVQMSEIGQVGYRDIDTVDATSYLVDTLTADLTRYYRVYSVITITPPRRLSNAVTVRLSRPIRPVTCIPADTIAVRDLREGAVLRVRYSADAMPFTPIDPIVAQLTRPDGTPLVLASSVMPTSNAELLIRFDALLTSAVPNDVRLELGSFRDRNEMWSNGGTFSLTVDTSSEEPEVFLASLRVVDPATIVLRYSEPVTTTTASDVANYALSPSGAVSSVNANGSDSVVVSLDPSSAIGARGITYYITVQNVVGLSGARMTTGPGSTLGFSFSAPSLDAVYVYPHPVYLGSTETVTFANLTTNATIEILDARFQVIARVQERDGNGGATWDLRTDNGDRIPPGIFYYRVSGTNTDNAEQESGLRKIMIRR
jgi:subtilisin family serine protease